jgi:hypothetical protein
MNDPGSQDDKVITRYRRNLVLLVVFMILLAVWFQRHLQTYVTEIFLVGGTLTLWAFWQIVQSWLKWGWDEESAGLRKRLLSDNRATEYLVFGLVLLIILWCTTSSIYLAYEGNTKDQASFKVQVLQDGKPYLRPLEVSSYERVAGRPYFLRWRSVNLDFEVVDPPGYEARHERLAAWTGIYLRVPADFTLRTFRVLRVVPLTHFNTLPKVDNGHPDVLYSLKISRGGPCGSTAAGIETFLIDDLRRQAVYIGASEPDLKWLIGKRDDRKFHEEFANALARNHVPEDKRQEWTLEWEANPRFVPLPAFGEKDPVCIQILQAGVQDPLLQKFLPNLTFKESIRSEYLEGAQ